MGNNQRVDTSHEAMPMPNDEFFNARWSVSARAAMVHCSISPSSGDSVWSIPPVDMIRFQDTSLVGVRRQDSIGTWGRRKDRLRRSQRTVKLKLIKLEISPEILPGNTKSRVFPQIGCRLGPYLYT